MYTAHFPKTRSQQAFQPTAVFSRALTALYTKKQPNRTKPASGKGFPVEKYFFKKFGTVSNVSIFVLFQKLSFHNKNKQL